MAVGFGFSVGDFIAGLNLLKQSIDAVSDSRGALKDYRSLIGEIDVLRDCLKVLDELHIDENSFSGEKQAIENALANCNDCIGNFL
ncbi:hypothetical protein N7481_002896 [Penicillium waksmanii]|uniref:uncharacterized protein n=1 Tax=Penicillium waksmanii TaxID=69791 RepID=UPI002547EEEF|nr:uncharacterized protein N7481_013484 [Penicillium waksmanii]XP_057127047.1 uncharacterized protein N7481_002896 [Penicillium waksmanii]KAJ5963179.1 hypothetical protein N7481_013484 [Penicillium waksmanii]KAJ5995919.1 hypothetical protein N7481_002896 [Penicillium waksmanii]